MIERVAEAAQIDVSRETFAALSAYVDLLLEESERQNLIARSTIDEVWTRHIIDSAQLVRFAPAGASWLDIGSGAGLPGLVIAILVNGPVTLVEPRRLRADFLSRAVEQLRLDARVAVVQAKIETVQGRFDLITARAFAPIERIFEVSLPLASRTAQWVLPRGQSGKSELADAQRTWQGAFRTEASITDPHAAIVLASGIAKRGRG